MEFFHELRAGEGGLDDGAAERAGKDERERSEPSALESNGQKRKLRPEEEPQKDIAERHPLHEWRRDERKAFRLAGGF